MVLEFSMSTIQDIYRIWDVAFLVELVDYHGMVHVREVYVGERDGSRVTIPALV